MLRTNELYEALSKWVHRPWLGDEREHRFRRDTAVAIRARGGAQPLLQIRAPRKIITGAQEHIICTNRYGNHTNVYTSRRIQIFCGTSGESCLGAHTARAGADAVELGRPRLLGGGAARGERHAAVRAHARRECAQRRAQFLAARSGDHVAHRVP